MTAEAQRIAIAEFCGWTQRTEGMFWSATESRAAILQGSSLESTRRKMKLSMDGKIMLPDWLKDLNAMHEAEKHLKDDQLSQYTMYLEGDSNPMDTIIFDIVHTTAAQRAEAFLKTLGLWQP